MNEKFGHIIKELAEHKVICCRQFFDCSIQLIFSSSGASSASILRKLTGFMPSENLEVFFICGKNLFKWGCGWYNYIDLLEFLYVA